jgi:hypothetical protein
MERLMWAKQSHKRTIPQVIPIFIAGIPRIPPSHHHI